ncbi:hypothetical protein ElyMa_005934400, partial [Elysia marginata]
FENFERTYPCQEPFDFVVLVGNESDSDARSHAVVGDIRSRAIGTPRQNYKHAKAWRFFRKQPSFKKQSSNRLKLSRKNTTTNLSFPKLFSQTQFRKSKNLSSLTKSKYNVGCPSVLKDGKFRTEVYAPHKNKEFLASDDIQRHVVPPISERKEKDIEHPSIENDAWFDLLMPLTHGWSFEYDNETLLSSLKNMSSSSDSRGYDLNSVVVSYDRHQTFSEDEKVSNDKQGNNTEDVDSPAYPYDPLYEHAMEFAKVHGYGFVKFVTEDDVDEAMEEERAKKLRKMRTHRRRRFCRNSVNGNAFVKKEDKCHSLNSHTPAYASSLKFGLSTPRGLCGGRPRNPETFWHESYLESTLDSMKQDMDEVRQISKDIKEALTAEIWLNVSPECREQTRAWFHFEKQSATTREKKSSSPKRKASPNKPHAKNGRLIPRRLRSFDGNSQKQTSCPLSHSFDNVSSATSPQSKATLQRARSASGRGYSRRKTPLQANYMAEKWIPYSDTTSPENQPSKARNKVFNRRKSFVERRQDNLDDGFAKTSKHVGTSDEINPQKFPSEYQALVREMCKMNNHRFPRIWPTDEEACGGESMLKPNAAVNEDTRALSSSQEIEKKDIKNKEKVKYFETVTKETTSICSEESFDKANNICFKTSGDAANGSDERVPDGHVAGLWLPGVMSKKTSKQYRLCNSLSATIFRESQLHSTSSCDLGHIQNNLSISPLEVVYVGDNNRLPPSDEFLKGSVSQSSSLSLELTSREEKVDNIIPKFLSFEDNRKEMFAKIEKNNCVGFPASEREHHTPDQHQDTLDELSSKAIEVDIYSPQNTRCVRIKRSSNILTPHLMRASISNSGHFVAGSGSRAGSCPNLTTHTSKMHRISLLKHSIQFRKSLSPNLGGRVLLRNSPVNNTKPISPQATLCSRVGDCSSIKGESSKQAAVKLSETSPDRTTITRIRCFQKQKGLSNAVLQSAPSVVLRQNTSSHLARHKSPRRKYANHMKNALTVEIASQAKLHNNQQDLKNCAFSQSGISTNNNKMNESWNTTDGMRTNSANKQDKCLQSRSESSLLRTKELDSNNNAGSKNCSLDDKIQNVPTPRMSCYSPLQNFPKIQTTCPSNSLTLDPSPGWNNNAFQTRDGSPDKAHPNVSNTKRRRKWGPTIKSPKFQNCTLSENSPISHTSPLRNEPLKLPALPIPHRHEILMKPSFNTEHGQVLPDEPKPHKKNRFSRYESIPVGFGAALPKEDIEIDDNDDNFGSWETKTPRSTRTLNLQPANGATTQPHLVAQRKSSNCDKYRQKRCNHRVASPVHMVTRDHPLNQSYIIGPSLDANTEATEDQALHLPSAMTNRRQRQGCCSPHVAYKKCCNSRQHAPFSTLSAVEAKQVFPHDRMTQFELTPNPSLESSELFGSHSCGFASRTRTHLSILQNAKEKKRANKNNNFLLCNYDSVLSTRSTPNCKLENKGVSSSTQGLRSDLLGCVRTSVHRNATNDTSVDNVFRNVSNNASSSSDDKMKSHQENGQIELGSISAQQLRELEREMSYLIEEGNSGVNDLNSSHHSSEESSIKRTDLNRQSFSNEISNVPQSTWVNINNASSMNWHRGREREHLRRRRLQSESMPSPGLITIRDSRASSENGNQEREDGEIPMDDSQTQKQVNPDEAFQSLNINPNTPFSLPSRSTSNPLWRNMLSQDPTTRKLWSCVDQERRKSPADYRQINEEGLAITPRLRNGVPYCPTTENYWQMALNPNTPAPTFGFRHSPESINNAQEPICSTASSNHILSGSSQSCEPNTEEMVVEGHETNSSHVAVTSQFGYNNLMTFADLYRQLDSLWLRSQNEVSQRLEAIGESMNARLKQLQSFVERHITQRHNTSSSSFHDNSDDSRSSFKKGKYPSIHLKRKATKVRRLPNSFSLDTAKYKRKTEDSLQASNETACHDAKKEKVGTSSGWTIFPTIKFKEMRSEENQHSPNTENIQTFQKSNLSQTFSPRFQRVPQRRHEGNAAVGSQQALRKSSSTCSCNFRHTRSCRRRRGMEGTRCNLCLLSNRRGIGRRRRSSSTSSRGRHVGVKTKSTKRKFLKSILKQPKTTINKQPKIGRAQKKSSKLFRHRVRFGKVSYANPSTKRSLKKRATEKKYVSRNHRKSKKAPRRTRVTAKRQAYGTRGRSTSVRRRKKSVDHVSKNRHKTAKGHNRLYHSPKRNFKKKNSRNKNSTIAHIYKTTNTATYRANRRNSTKRAISTRYLKNNRKKMLKRSKRKPVSTRESNNSNYHGIHRLPTSRREKRGETVKAWFRYYGNASNSNKITQCVKKRKDINKKEKDSSKYQGKSILKRGKPSTVKKANATHSKKLQYIITSTGYSSLIRKLKLKYERMCSIRQHSSKSSLPDQQLSSRSTERMVEQFKRVICRNPASKLTGLKKILTPLDSSTETVCHLQHQNAREAPHPRQSWRYVQTRAAIRDKGMEACLMENKHLAPDYKGRCDQFSRYRPHLSTLHANDSPPKLQTPGTHSDELSAPLVPENFLLLQNPHRSSRNTVAPDNFAGSPKHRINSHDCPLRQVDSIELNRRRLAKRSNNVSRNACCYEFQKHDSANYSTSNVLSTAEKTNFDYVSVINYLPNLPDISISLENFTSKATNSFFWKPPAFSNEDKSPVYTLTSSSASTDSLQKQCNGHICRKSYFESLRPANDESFHAHYENNVKNLHSGYGTNNMKGQDLRIRIYERTSNSDSMNGHKNSPKPTAPIASQGSLKETTMHVKSIQESNISEKDSGSKSHVLNNACLPSEASYLNQSDFGKKVSLSKDCILKDVNDLKQGGIGPFGAHSGSVSSHKIAITISNFNEFTSKEGLMQKELEPMNSKRSCGQNIGPCKHEKRDISGSNKDPYLYSCPIPKSRQKEYTSSLSQPEGVETSQAEMCPQTVLRKKPNMSNNETKNYPVQTDQNCGELRNYEDEHRPAYLPACIRSKDTKQDKGCDIFKGTEVNHGNIDQTLPLSFQPPTTTRCFLGQETTACKSREASCPSIESEDARLERYAHLQASSIIAENRVKEGRNSDTQETLSTNPFRILVESQTEKGLNGYLDAAIANISKEQVSQQSYLDVKSPGLCTTWVSVPLEDSHKSSSSNSTHVGTTSFVPGTDFLGSTLGEKLAAKECHQEPPQHCIYIQRDLNVSSEVEGSTAPSNDTPPQKNGSNDLLQGAERDESQLNTIELGETVGVSLPSENSASVMAIHPKISNSNLFSDNVVPNFERDELIFPSENLQQYQTGLSRGILESSDLPENFRRRMVFSVYRQSRNGKNPNTNSTHSSSTSSIENNNNAAESQLVFNCHAIITNPDDPKRTTVSSIACPAQQADGKDSVKHNGKCLFYATQHHDGNATGHSFLQPGISLKPLSIPSKTETRHYTSCRDRPTKTAIKCQSSGKGNPFSYLISPRENNKMVTQVYQKEKCPLFKISTANNNHLFSPATCASSTTPPKMSGTPVADNGNHLSHDLTANSFNILHQTLTKCSDHFSTLPLEFTISENARKCENKEQRKELLYRDHCTSANSASHCNHGTYSSKPSSLKELTNCCKNWITLGKRKRELVCSLSDSTAPPLKVHRKDPYMKGLEERKRRLVHRRLLWQQRREKRFLALRENERKKKILDSQLKRKINASQFDPVHLHQRRDPHKARFRYYSSSDADCESN